MQTVNVKQELHKLADQLSDDATWEDVQYHLYAVEKIQKGLKCIEEGRTVSHDEVEKRLGKWLES